MGLKGQDGAHTAGKSPMSALKDRQELGFAAAVGARGERGGIRAGGGQVDGGRGRGPRRSAF